jgi:6-phosphogluconolactonase
MKPEIRIFKSIEELSHKAAEIFVERASRAIEERGRFLVALNGGSTPSRLFQLLGTDYRGQIDWNKTHIFWGDERLVPAENPESSYGQARDLFLSQADIPAENIHPINGKLEPADAATEYANTLKQFAAAPLEFPRFDLIYLGMGEDGHTASLFPGSAVDTNDLVIPVTAQYQDRPSQRITLTPRVFNAAHRIAFMATGEKKARTLAEVLSDKYKPEYYPVQRIEPKNGRVLWLVDEDAASRLPTHLVRRFCEG